MIGCGCGLSHQTGHGHQLSRRHVLKAAAAGAAIAAASGGAKRAFAQAGVKAIDIHAHYFPQGYLDLFNSEGKSVGAEYRTAPEGWYWKTGGLAQGPLPAKFIDLKQRVAEMDQQGVAVQALSLTAPMIYWAPAELSHKLAKAWNDGASAAHQEYPQRLVGLITLPMLAPDRAVDELERAAKLPGMRGVYLGTNIHDRDLDDPMFLPVYAKIEALGLPVFLHPLKTIGGDRMKPYYLSNLLGNPYDTGIAACHLIFGGILDKFPKLEVSLPHSGGTLPILIGRIDHGWKVRKETKHLANAPSSYLRRFTYDTISHDPAIMKFVISQVGADRIMLGSDYCYDMGYERPVQFVEQLNLDQKDRDMIIGGTAAKLLKL
jgi:aminocarboxymuconate-semialdehyde decarboxylase